MLPVPIFTPYVSIRIIKKQEVVLHKNTLLGVLIFSSSNFLINCKKNSILVRTLFCKIQKTLLFHLYKDHRFQVNLWNIGIWRHALYTSKQVLIYRLNLRHELSIIWIISLIQTVQDDLPQVSIKPIGFTVEIILKDIILLHCCGLVFCVKCLSKWAAKESKLSSCINF